VRDWEVERALAADVVQRTSGAIETGRVMVRINDGGQDFGAVFLPGVRLDVYHHGLYDPVLELAHASTWIAYERGGESQLVRLSTILPSVTTAVDGKAFVTHFGDRTDALSVVRTVEATPGNANSIGVRYHIRPAVDVELRSLQFNVEGEQILVGEGSAPATIESELFDGTIVPITVITSWDHGMAPPLAPPGEGEWQTLTIELRVPTGERRTDVTTFYDPVSILRGYGIRYIINRDGDGASYPLIRRYDLLPVHENADYKIYELN
jgi:hypothetical protein